MRYRFLVPFLLLTSVLAAEQVLSVGTTVLTQADLAALEGPTLVFLPLEVPLTVRVNGALASQRGNLDQPYTGRLHWATALSLQPWASPALGDLRVEIQLQPAEGEPSVLGPVRLLSRTEALDWVFWRNFWGPQAITALSWASLVVGLSSFLLFLVGHRLPRRDRVLYLVYFLTNLTFAVSYINNVFSWDLAPTLELDKLSRAGMYWWLYFATAANVLYLQPPARPGRVLVPAAAVIAVVTVLLALAPSVPAVSTLQRLVGIPLLSVLLLYLLVRSVLLLVRHRDWQAGLLVVVYLLGAWAMVADSVPYFVLKYKPTVMLAPFTAFLSDLAFLWLLA
ncbi:MAG: hypothetical protein WCJ71_02155, partial [Candidatus Omnitrophota bacterium]